MTRFCSMPGCFQKHKAKGLCIHHYDVSDEKKLRRKSWWASEKYKAWMNQYGLTANRKLRRYFNSVVNNAIQRRMISSRPCEQCGAEQAIAHHDNYLPGNELNIRWLCNLHHAEWHKFHNPEYPNNK